MRHSIGMTDIYNNRKQTIERLFRTAKEFHGLPYTNLTGKEKMHMKLGLTFAYLNIKKLAKILNLRGQEALSFLSTLNYLPKLITEYKTDQLITLND